MRGCAVFSSFVAEFELFGDMKPAFASNVCFLGRRESDNVRIFIHFFWYFTNTFAYVSFRWRSQLLAFAEVDNLIFYRKVFGSYYLSFVSSRSCAQDCLWKATLSFPALFGRRGAFETLL